jgi:C4-dicarboxylate-specific signal transduction histidine kinase
MSNSLVETVDIRWLREAYFSDLEKRIHLKAGETLLEPETHNQRLYLILKGSLVGCIEDESGESFEIFRSTTGMFVGVYSYFSHSHRSYSTVRAEMDSVLAYLEPDTPAVKDEQGRTFAEHFLPVIVNEIYIRQLFAQKVSQANQIAMKHLYQAEKMATLGQLAAGLAHELNNAIGVIQRKTDWLASRLKVYLQEKDTRNMFPYFQRGFQKGQWLSSAEIRQRKRGLEKQLNLAPALAKKLAKAGITEPEIRQLKGSLDETLERVNYYYETGVAMHDISLAANHAAHVVRSVKELGTAQRGGVQFVDLNHTLHEALSLIKKLLSKVEVRLDLQDLPLVRVNAGDFVQIWVNILKNAVEAMAQVHDRQSLLDIRSGLDTRGIFFTLTDNGPGISPNIIDRIFQPDVTTKVQGLSFGLGLGLSIVKKMIEGYGGTISVKSKPGKTTFTIRIPK